jgi:hypothetical protein
MYRAGTPIPQDIACPICILALATECMCLRCIPARLVECSVPPPRPTSEMIFLKSPLTQQKILWMQMSPWNRLKMSDL